MRILKNIYHRINHSPFIAGNDFKTNFLLVLSFVTYIIIVIDLESELAVERDEISGLVATLEESITTIQLDSADQISIKLQHTGSVEPLVSSSYSTELYNVPHERSPPSFV